MSLRIGYMTGEYPRATDTFIQREVAALRNDGVHVQTFSVRKPPEKENVGPEQQAERSSTQYMLPASPWTLIASHAHLLRTSPGRYLQALRLAFRARAPGMRALLLQMAYFAEAGLVAARMREHQLVHLHNHFSNSSCSVAMLAAELGGFTFSFTMHGPAEFFEPHVWRLDEKIKRALFVCCISSFCRSQAMIFSPADKWARLHIIHCGVEPALFTRVKHANQGKRLLFVGRLAPVKGLPILLDAIEQLRNDRPDVVLTIAGDGPDRPRLEEQARTKGIGQNIRFLGYQSQAQVRQLLDETDVFVISSFAEGVPVVLMEAMAAGVPVVATRIAGIPELVEDGVSGFLVPPGDAQALAERIFALLEDDQIRNRFGKAGRAEVEAEFNIQTEARRLCMVLTGALEGRAEAVRPEIERKTDMPASTQTAPPRPVGAVA